MNAKKNAMAATVPVVRQLRKVPGFDPLKYLRTVSRNGEKVLKLDLSYKKLRLRLPKRRKFPPPLLPRLQRTLLLREKRRERHPLLLKLTFWHRPHRKLLLSPPQTRPSIKSRLNRQLLSRRRPNRWLRKIRSRFSLKASLNLRMRPSVPPRMPLMRFCRILPRLLNPPLPKRTLAMKPKTLVIRRSRTNMRA